jgi:hypothetical protein
VDDSGDNVPLVTGLLFPLVPSTYQTDSTQDGIGSGQLTRTATLAKVSGPPWDLQAGPI